MFVLIIHLLFFQSTFSQGIRVDSGEKPVNYFTASHNLIHPHYLPKLESLNKRKRSPKVFPYTEKGLLPRNIPPNSDDVESSILDDLRRQTYNFSSLSQDRIKPVFEDNSDEFALSLGGPTKKPLMEHIKHKTNYKEIFEGDTPMRKPSSSTFQSQTPTQASPAKVVKKSKKQKKSSNSGGSYGLNYPLLPSSTPIYDFMNFDAFIQHKPKNYFPVSSTTTETPPTTRKFKPTRSYSAELQNYRPPPPTKKSSSSKKYSKKHSYEWEEKSPKVENRQQISNNKPSVKGNLYQDMYSKHTFPYHVEFGHLSESPQGWEERFQDIDLVNHKNRGKAIWHDKNSGYGQQFWDLS